jgi:hypothetical protein
MRSCGVASSAASSAIAGAIGRSLSMGSFSGGF